MDLGWCWTIWCFPKNWHYTVHDVEVMIPPLKQRLECSPQKQPPPLPCMTSNPHTRCTYNLSVARGLGNVWQSGSTHVELQGNGGRAPLNLTSPALLISLTGRRRSVCLAYTLQGCLCLFCLSEEATWDAAECRVWKLLSLLWKPWQIWVLFKCHPTHVRERWRLQASDYRQIREVYCKWGNGMSVYAPCAHSPTQTQWRFVKSAAGVA